MQRDIAARYPDESAKKYRQRVSEQVRHTASLMVTAVRQLPNESQRQEATAAFQEWEEVWQKKARDGDFIPVLDDDGVTEIVAQFNSKVLPGFSEYFFCRRKDCGMLCRETDWIGNVGDNHEGALDKGQYL